MILKELKKKYNDTCGNTEYILADIQDINESTSNILKQDVKLMVGSLDVEALYSSLDVHFSAKIVANEVYLQRYRDKW